MDIHQSLSNVIRQAITDAWSEGQSDVEQINNAVRMVQAVRPNISIAEAMEIVNRFKAERQKQR